MAEVSVATKRRGRRPRRPKRAGLGLGATISLVVLGVIFILAVTGSMAAPEDPEQLSRDLLQPPSSDAWMGTDTLGRDVLSRVIAGARATTIIGICAALVGGVIGIVVGALAGYFGRWIDFTLMRIAELVQVLPNFFLAILAVAVLGPGLDRTILVIGFLSWPAVARLTRSQFLTLKERPFVEAARASGASTTSIICREILPNAMAPLTVQLSFDVAGAILVEAGLGFLGLSDPAFITWGALLQDAQRYLVRAWWLGIFPGMAILLTVASLNVLGDALNDRWNPRTKKR